ncbi:MAG TPA: exodeoxyribonuclease VII large subunit [Planctomycetota bacterium]|nr:exodeoxyribonuclease VII large subunit [Planctomycetota bacterium]
MRRGLLDTGITRPAPPGADPKTGKPRAWTVSQLTRHIKDCVERGYPNLWVEGEISNFKAYGSGHIYFTLKDDGAQLSSVIWRTSAERLRFMPDDGAKVLAHGRLSVYEPRGCYQFIVDRLEPLGVGDLSAAFEQLKRKLADEGLFASERKRRIPRFPRRIGIVTSPSGAAFHDLSKVIFARWPADLILAGVRVQGDGAAAEIVAGIRALNRLAHERRPDVLIVGRGGGSLEDLWAFNEEIVARAIVASAIPVISAVGHEIDFTIADFAADARAATPSHAGEMVVPRFDDTLAQLEGLRGALPLALLKRLELARHRLDSFEQSYALRHPEQSPAMLRQRLDGLAARLYPQPERLLRRLRDKSAALSAQLDSLSPLRVLTRGYSVTRKVDGTLVDSVKKVARGDKLRTRVADGEIDSQAI